MNSQHKPPVKWWHRLLWVTCIVYGHDWLDYTHQHKRYRMCILCRYCKPK